MSDLVGELQSQEMPALPERHVFLLQNAAENIKDLKDGQTSITNYAMLLYAAVYAVRHEIKHCSALLTIGFCVTLAIIFVLALKLLQDLDNAKQVHRYRLKWIEDRYYSPVEIRDLVLGSAKSVRSKDTLFFRAMVFVLGGGAALAAVLVWSIAN